MIQPAVGVRSAASCSCCSEKFVKQCMRVCALCSICICTKKEKKKAKAAENLQQQLLLQLLLPQHKSPFSAMFLPTQRRRRRRRRTTTDRNPKTLNPKRVRRSISAPAYGVVYVAVIHLFSNETKPSLGAGPWAVH